MLPIILNNLFTRHRKDMAEAEKARAEARLNQRLTPRVVEGDGSEQDKKPSAAPAQPQLPPDQSEKG